MHAADAVGWRRFTRVTQSVPSGHKLYRASSPNYRNKDSDQKLTQAAVDFLVSQGIDSIISFNAHEYTLEEQERLAKAVPPIRYLHLGVGDFRPPTLAQLQQAHAFFLQNTATLVHCGYGWGRTGTCVTGLQLYTENGRTLQPPGESWTMWLLLGGNSVEKRAQVSVLAQLRNLLFPRVMGKPLGDPKQTFAIINFATGYYLTPSPDDGSVIALSPETVETISTIEQAHQWVITRDEEDNYTLASKTTGNVALTKSQGAEINDLLTSGTSTQGNTRFAITEVTPGEKGRYVISPHTSATLAVAINTPENNDPLPNSAQMPVLLAPRDENNDFGLWILLPADFETRHQETQSWV